MAVTRDDVIHTAIQLLQEVGLDGLTLRRLATELGISAPTLYWHVRDKRELLDLMSEQMIRDHRAQQAPMAEGLEWHEIIAEGARRQFAAINAYRDGARVVAGNRPTEAQLPMIERYMRLWVSAGFPPEEALASILAMGDFINGSALEHQAELERSRLQDQERQKQVWKNLDDYPTMKAAAKARMDSKGERPTSFEHGLGLFIAGLRQRQAELLAEKAEAAERRPLKSGTK
jgi:TetR/AcrR family transcriptional regulator, tetracycline repressor protein